MDNGQALPQSTTDEKSWRGWEDAMDNDNGRWDGMSKLTVSSHANPAWSNTALVPLHLRAASNTAATVRRRRDVL